MDLNNLKEMWDKLSLEEQKHVYEIFRNEEQGGELYRTLKSFIFRGGIEPPSPEQFLDWRNGWISKQFSESVFDHVKQDFIDVVKGNQYETVALYGAVRCHGKGVKILMHNFTIKNIEDVQVGDLLMGEDGSPRTVTQLHRGRDTLYEVHQNKGDSYTVTGDHILALQYSNGKQIEKTAKDYLNLDPYHKEMLYGRKALPASTTGIRITEIGEDDYFGISVDGDNRYLLGDFTVTHNCGKSYLARLLIMYTMVFFHHLLNPQMYYGVSPNTSLTIFITSFKFDKIQQVYLVPLYQMLQSSERFLQVKQRNLVYEQQDKIGNDVIVWSEAALADHAHITLASRLNLASGNDEQINILGNDAFQVYISELAYFIENAGATEEKIFEFYTKASDRIKNTVGRGKKLAFTYLDTSANNAESKIENYILKDLAKSPTAFYQSRSLWEARPYLFPVWQETGETFRMCTGDGNFPAQFITDDLQEQNMPRNLIIDIPIDVKEEFERNPIQSIRDLAGRPTSAESKFIQQRKLIIDLFDRSIENVEGVITADSKDTSENLIWNQVCDKFFVKYDGINYTPRRAPNEPRYIGLDLAVSVRGDLAGLVMLHREMRQNGDPVTIVDFAFPVGPGANGINLEAIQMFIVDLAAKGGIQIKQVNVDQYQSENMIQYLKRHSINALRSSVDRNIQPYMVLYSSLLAGTLKAGPNVFLRNNLDSLYRVRTLDKTGREKIDHSEGPQKNIYLGDYEKSDSGIHAKDVSDALVQALYAMQLDNPMPLTVYEKQQSKLEKVPLSFVDEGFRSRIAEARAVLNKGIGAQKLKIG